MRLYSPKDLIKVEQARRLQTVNEKYGVKTCFLEDREYPVNLKNISDRPPVLYYKGNISVLNEHENVAVIGTRRASEKGLKLAYETGRYVAESKFNLINGLALGCDSQALKGALEEGGKCVAILPCGLEQILPKTNIELADKIVASGGCILSEYPIGVNIQRYNYVERDRLQSGVSQGVIVIETQQGSGTMHTVEFARHQARRLACYSSKLMELAFGNQYMEKGNRATILENKKDLLEFLQKLSDDLPFEQMTLDL